MRSSVEARNIREEARCDPSRVIYHRVVWKSIDHSGEKKKKKKEKYPEGACIPLLTVIKISHEHSCRFVIFLPFRVPFCHTPPYTVKYGKATKNKLSRIRDNHTSYTSIFWFLSTRVIEGWTLLLRGRFESNRIQDLAFNCVKSSGFVRRPLFFLFSFDPGEIDS